MDLISVGVGLGAGAVGTTLGVIIRGYFSNRDKKSDKTDDRFDKFKEETLKERTELYVELTKLTGKMDALTDKFDLYAKETSKLEGKVEQNTEALVKQNSLLDHISRQNKRLFEHLGLRRPSIDGPETGR